MKIRIGYFRYAHARRRKVRMGEERKHRFLIIKEAYPSIPRRGFPSFNDGKVKSIKHAVELGDTGLFQLSG